MRQGQVQRVDACRLIVGDRRWEWAANNADGIVANWQTQLAKNPRFFNGRIQILTRYRIEGGVFSGNFTTTDFASFIHWRGLGYPDPSVHDCFGCAILRSNEGHILLGRQAAGNLNSGRAYCPGGFIDPADVRPDRSIDIDGSIQREIGEETGLDLMSLRREPGYVLVAADASIAIGVVYRSAMSANDLRAQIMAHITSESAPELADILIVRTPADIADVKTSGYVVPLVQALLG